MMAGKSEDTDGGIEKAEEKRLKVLKQLFSRSKRKVKEKSEKNPVVFRTIDRTADYDAVLTEKQKHILYVAKLVSDLWRVKPQKKISEDEILALMLSLLNEEQLGELFFLKEKVKVSDSLEPESKKEDE